MLETPTPATIHRGSRGRVACTGTATATATPQLTTWHVASSRRALMLSVTYWDASEQIVTVDVEYEWPGVHGNDLPRSVRDELEADVERHYGNCEYASYFERELEQEAA